MVVYSVSVLFYSYSSLVCIVTAFGMGYRTPVISTSSATGVWTLGSKGKAYVGVMSIQLFYLHRMLSLLCTVNFDSLLIFAIFSSLLSLLWKILSTDKHSGFLPATSVNFALSIGS